MSAQGSVLPAFEHQKRENRAKPKSQEHVLGFAVHHLWKPCIKSFKNFENRLQLCSCLEFSSHLFVFPLLSSFLFNIPIHYNKYIYYTEIQLVSQSMSTNNIFLSYILDTRKASLFPDSSSYFTSRVFSRTVCSIICLTKESTRQNTVTEAGYPWNYLKICLKVFYFTGFWKAKLKNVILKKKIFKKWYLKKPKQTNV